MSALPDPIRSLTKEIRKLQEQVRQLQNASPSPSRAYTPTGSGGHRLRHRTCWGTTGFSLKGNGDVELNGDLDVNGSSRVDGPDDRQWRPRRRLAGSPCPRTASGTRGSQSLTGCERPSPPTSSTGWSTSTPCRARPRRRSPCRLRYDTAARHRVGARHVPRTPRRIGSTVAA